MTEGPGEEARHTPAARQDLPETGPFGSDGWNNSQGRAPVGEACVCLSVSSHLFIYCFHSFPELPGRSSQKPPWFREMTGEAGGGSTWRTAPGQAETDA